MNEPRYTGEEILAMLEEHHIDPDDLPDILRWEQVRRRNALLNEMYSRILDGDDDLAQTIVDSEVIRELLFMFVSGARVLRDELGYRDRDIALIDSITEVIDDEPAEGSTP